MWLSMCVMMKQQDTMVSTGSQGNVHTYLTLPRSKKRTGRYFWFDVDLMQNKLMSLFVSIRMPLLGLKGNDVLLLPEL